MPNETLVSNPHAFLYEHGDFVPFGTQQIQISMLSLDELFVPAWNPRKYIDPIEQANLMGYIERGGRTQRIEVLKAERASSLSELAHPNHGPRPEASAQGGYWVISGQRRMLAFRQLKRTHIKRARRITTGRALQLSRSSKNQGSQ
jgi:hypothetical protein